MSAASVRYAKEEPYIAHKEPYIAHKEPCITSERDPLTLVLRSGMLKEPCITLKRALHRP